MQHSQKHCALAALSLLMLEPAGAALAAEEAGKAQTMVVEDMVVTATRTERRSIDVPITTAVITQEEIQNSGMTDVADLLSKKVTGHFHKYNGLLSPVGLRGFRSDSHGDDLSSTVRILVDGHRIGTGNAAKINLDRIERVEITKGPASALYGSAAMGGVVNLITKKGDGKLGGSVGMEYGSFDALKGLATAGGEVNEHVRFFGAISADTINDYDAPKFGTVYNSDSDKANFGGNFVYSLNDQHEVRIGGNYAKLKGGYPSWLDSVTYSAYDKETQSWYDKSTGYADLEYNGDYFAGKLHWRSLYYYLRDKNHWNTDYYSENGITHDPLANQSKYIDSTLGTDQQLTWKMTGWNTLVAGFLVENMEKESWAVSNYQSSAPYTPGLNYDNQALFVQDSLDLWDNRINIIAAGRYDRFEVETKPGETGHYTDFRSRSESYSHFSPKLGAGVKFFDERLRLRGNLGQGFKSPTADQLSADYYDSSSSTRTLGNPDLDPETTLTWGFGVDLMLDAFTVKLDWYHTDYKDKIVRKPGELNGEKVSTYDNHGEAKLGGLELMLQWQIDKNFALPFTASLWSNMEFNTENEDKESGTDMLYVSDYDIKSGLDLGYKGLHAQISHVLVGPQMITNYDTYEDEKKGSFDFWDLTVRYEFAEHWEVRAGVYNIFDQKVEWVRGYLMPERNYRIGLTFKF